MTEEQEKFLNRLMDRFNVEYPPRYITGVNKYKSTIHKDYTVQEHIRNLREELMDAFAYLEAIEMILENEDEPREN